MADGGELTRERELPGMGNMKRRVNEQHGAAILLALLIMTLVATLAAGMVWLQWRGHRGRGRRNARAHKLRGC